MSPSVVTGRPRAVLYTRVSTDEQAERGYSLRVQEERLRAYCHQHGIDVAEHFQDDASAKTFERRPAFQEALAFLKKNRGRITSSSSTAGTASHVTPSKRSSW